MIEIIEIEKQTGIDNRVIRSIIKNEKIKVYPTKPQTIPTEDENKILRILFFQRKIDYIIIESKINEL